MLNILIVDDSEVDRLLMEGLLKRSIGFEVLWAEDGKQAMERLEQWNVDVIVTDLQMPEMDGLELVREVRKVHPQIPIILTTGVGSEEIAAQALNDGAAGYVPKSHLNTMLVPTVRGVLNILNAQRNYNSLLQRANAAQFSFTLESDPKHFPPLVDFCEKMIRGMVRLDRIERLRIAIAIEHALNNALYRGNLEIGADYKIQLGSNLQNEDVEHVISDRLSTSPYKDRLIQVDIKITRESITIRVRDEGPGFDPGSAGSWSESSSRGLILMKSFMDDVKFNDTGNEVALRRRWTNGQYRRVAGQESATKTAEEPPKTLGKLKCDQTGNVVALTIEKFVIGRRDSCHLVLPFRSVGESHCLLLHENGEWFAKNLAEENISLVNGKPIDYVKLQSGDLISIGAHDFQIEFD